MKFKSNVSDLCILAASSLFALAYSQAAESAEPAASDAPGAMQMSTGAITDGEVRKVDKENKKFTLKHGEIKNLEMPGMTMVFQVKDPAMLDMVKLGDMVMFEAEKANGAMVVTDIKPFK